MVLEPIDGHPEDVHHAVLDYSAKLQQSDIPKILFYAHPGGLITSKTVAWCKEKLPHLTTVDIGPGLHYVQEDNPTAIGEGLAKWYQEID